MSTTPDPTAGITVSGGLTVVETIELVAAATVVAEAVLRVESALAEARRAHGLVSGFVTPFGAASSVGGSWGGSPGCARLPRSSRAARGPLRCRRRLPWPAARSSTRSPRTPRC
ncbi:hypothetical protein NKG05_14960 [Oerskovia sp. M15]